MFLSGQYYENKIRAARVDPDEKKIYLTRYQLIQAVESV